MLFLLEMNLNHMIELKVDLISSSLKLLVSDPGKGYKYDIVS